MTDEQRQRIGNPIGIGARGFRRVRVPIANVLLRPVVGGTVHTVIPGRGSQQTSVPPGERKA